MEPLTYKPYNKTKLAIRGDMQYDAIIKAIGGRWNSRMKEGPGWTIDNDKEEQLKMLIQNLNMSKVYRGISSNARLIKWLVRLALLRISIMILMTWL